MGTPQSLWNGLSLGNGEAMSQSEALVMDGINPDHLSERIAQYQSEALDDLDSPDEDAVYKFIDECGCMETLLKIMSAVIRRLLTGECQL